MTDEQFTVLFGAITAIATLAVPVVLAVMANRFNNRLKQWEAGQWRNQELIKARLDAYRQLVPGINDLLCYFTFVGLWKDLKPPQVVQIKRELDRAFHCAAPLFSGSVQDAYRDFVGQCFLTYGAWGADARLRTGFGRRQQAAGSAWDSAWNTYFEYQNADPIPSEHLRQVRVAYNELISAFVTDIELHDPRGLYTPEVGQLDAY